MSSYGEEMLLASYSRKRTTKDSQIRLWRVIKSHQTKSTCIGEKEGEGERGGGEKEGVGKLTILQMSPGGRNCLIMLNMKLISCIPGV